MKWYLNEIQGTADAITTMYFSKRSWTREREEHIRDLCYKVLDRRGFVDKNQAMKAVASEYPEYDEFVDMMNKLMKWVPIHITMGRFMDFSITVEGVHRAGQDDWDAHACRYNNRIIRTSTRLATFEADEMSEWYKDKIIPMDLALRLMSKDLPNAIEKDGITYVRATNGYIREDMKDDKDVKRGLYMECIPSNFIFKVNLSEFAHVYKQRNKDSHANPEVKILCEGIADALYKANQWITRELLMKIEN